MKKNVLKTVIILFVMIGLISTSCKKEKDDTNTPTDTETPTYIVKITKDNNPEIVFTKGAASVLGDKLIIGANNSESNIEFSLNPAIAEGTYTDGFLISYGVNGVAEFTTVTNTNSASLTITKHDKTTKHLTATFNVNYKDNENSAMNHTATGSIDITYP